VREPRANRIDEGFLRDSAIRSSTGLAFISPATVALDGAVPYWILVLSDYAVGPAGCPITAEDAW